MGEFQHDIIAAAIDMIAAWDGPPPDPNALAARFGYEPTHFQKMFKERAGISPKQMIRFLQHRRARDFLLQGYATLDAAHAAGLSGNGRLHELFVTIEAASPGEAKTGGAGMDIKYGFHPSPLGDILAAQSVRGVCFLAFVMTGDKDEAVHKMKAQWPRATFAQSPEETAPIAQSLRMVILGHAGERPQMRIYVRGTNFQVRVWQALLKIPSGAAMNYQHIANAIGQPKACRAVGSAVGANPVAFLIPCHRVIQKSGIVENYAWGSPRKKILLGLEGSHGRSRTSRIE